MGQLPGWVEEESCWFSVHEDLADGLIPDCEKDGVLEARGAIDLDGECLLPGVPAFRDSLATPEVTGGLSGQFAKV